MLVITEKIICEGTFLTIIFFTNVNASVRVFTVRIFNPVINLLKVFQIPTVAKCNLFNEHI